MFKFNKYNVFYYYNINYLFKASLDYNTHYSKKKLNYIKKFKNLFRHLLYINMYVYKFNFYIYFFKNEIKNNFTLNINSLNFSSFKSLRNLFFL
jgi:hypothetical protein